jgi:hypothetical protein
MPRLGSNKKSAAGAGNDRLGGVKEKLKKLTGIKF